MIGLAFRLGSRLLFNKVAAGAVLGTAVVLNKDKLVGGAKDLATSEEARAAALEDGKNLANNAGKLAVGAAETATGLATGAYKIAAAPNPGETATGMFKGWLKGLFTDDKPATNPSSEPAAPAKSVIESIKDSAGKVAQTVGLTSEDGSGVNGGRLAASAGIGVGLFALLRKAMTWFGGDDKPAADKNEGMSWFTKFLIVGALAGAAALAFKMFSPKDDFNQSARTPDNPQPTATQRLNSDPTGRTNLTPPPAAMPSTATARAFTEKASTPVISAPEIKPRTVVEVGAPTPALDEVK